MPVMCTRTRFPLTAELKAKGITAAWIPMSGIPCSKEIQDHCRSAPLGYGATYNAHPVATACAYEVIKHTLEADVLGNVKALAPVMEEEFPTPISSRQQSIPPSPPTKPSGGGGACRG